MEDNVDIFNEANLPFTEFNENKMDSNNESNKQDSNQKIEKNKDKTFKIQIILIIVWALLTALIYFFGYPLLSPFIKID